MGLFDGLKRGVRMSQAAAVVRGVLDPICKTGLMDGDPEALTTRLVALCWAQRPDVFDGKYGKPPHKIATAAIALASGFEEFRDQPGIKATLAVALAEILKEVELRGGLYPFHDLDLQLLRKAGDALLQEDAARRERFRGFDEILEEPSPRVRGPHPREIADQAASSLRAILMICASADGYGETLRSDFVRGYFFGFFDAAAQMAGLNFEAGANRASYLTVAHFKLLQGSGISGGDFVSASFPRQGLEEFEKGRAIGSDDFSAGVERKKTPVALLSLFHKG